MVHYYIRIFYYKLMYISIIISVLSKLEAVLKLRLLSYENSFYTGRLNSSPAINPAASSPAIRISSSTPMAVIREVRYDRYLLRKKKLVRRKMRGLRKASEAAQKPELLS